MNKKCSVCEKKHHAKGFCRSCYMRYVVRNWPLEKKPIRERGIKCSLCEKKYHAKGFCNNCYERHVSRKIPIGQDHILNRKKNGEGCLRKDGYRVIGIKGKRILEHKFIMEQFLKRPLRKNETLHHKNGVRDDNRIENLELWSTSHSNGQRVDDKIQWAIKFLTEYGFSVTKKDKKSV